MLDEGACTVVPNATRVPQDLSQPGTALVIYNDGHTDGPFTTDTTIQKINGGVPFQLFGRTIFPTQEEEFPPADLPRDLRDFLEFGQPQGPGRPREFLSDARLKSGIVFLEHLANGLNLYRYRYLWSDTDHVGVMAQEVEKVRPDAVVRGPDGYLRVDYARLGMELLTWDQWRAANKH